MFHLNRNFNETLYFIESFNIHKKAVQIERDKIYADRNGGKIFTKNSQVSIVVVGSIPVIIKDAKHTCDQCKNDGLCIQERTIGVDEPYVNDSAKNMVSVINISIS